MQGNVECADGLVLSTLGDCDVTNKEDGKMKAKDGRGKGNNFKCWAWKTHLLKVKAKVDRAFWILLEGLEFLGCRDFGLSKPILFGQHIGSKSWAPKFKLRPKSHFKFKPKLSQSLGFAMKPFESLDSTV